MQRDKLEAGQAANGWGWLAGCSHNHLRGNHNVQQLMIELLDVPLFPWICSGTILDNDCWSSCGPLHQPMISVSNGKTSRQSERSVGSILETSLR